MFLGYSPDQTQSGPPPHLKVKSLIRRRVPSVLQSQRRCTRQAFNYCNCELLICPLLFCCSVMFCTVSIQRPKVMFCTGYCEHGLISYWLFENVFIQQTIFKGFNVSEQANVAFSFLPLTQVSFRSKNHTYLCNCCLSLSNFIKVVLQFYCKLLLYSKS